jgi:hypothetical protein
VFGSVNASYFRVVEEIIAGQTLEDIAMYFRFKYDGAP